jgi:hypothetical protein
MRRKLTGNYFFKHTWFGVILMVEHNETDIIPRGWRTVWSKAKPEDLVFLNIDIKLKTNEG